MKSCKVCSCKTNTVFNIDFEAIPICESCSAAIFIQQAQWYTKQPSPSTNLSKVLVEIVTSKIKNYPTPHGLRYEAKGAYRQGKNIVVVGCFNPDNTVRIKYPAEDVKITVL
jgi:hypothetical protein